MKKLLIILTLFLVGCGSYSEGTRVGTISKFSKKGLFCKSWEGEMNLGGLSQTRKGKITANIWQFSVESSQIVNDLQLAQEKNVDVRLHYNQELLHGPCRSDTAYFITKVEFLK